MKDQTIVTRDTFKPIDWLNCTDKLLSYGFTREEIEKALEQTGTGVKELTDERGVQQYPHYYKTVEILKENHVFQTEVFQGEYSKKVNVRGWLVRVPGQYQGLKHGKVIEQLLRNRFEWFHAPEFMKTVTIDNPFTSPRERLGDVPKELQYLTVAELLKVESIKEEKSRWNLYEMYNSEKDSYEMYLTCENGSLYVPLSAIMKGDFSIIEERMNTYHSRYYSASGYALNHRGRTEEQYKADQEENRLKALAPLQSIQAIALKQYFSQEVK